ncbi:MAG TPA: helix-hairpin-helix domain-containing protein, partial [Anaerolineae bacterium]|nr:helix-hairpin-helix domain-containing protein [Anaerolineae bacterium]
MEIPAIVTETPEVAPAAAPPKVDLNTADATTLITLPGIGPVLAERILAYRETRGPFLAPEELLAVPGIGAKVYAGLAERLTLSLPAPEAATDADSAAADKVQASVTKAEKRLG